MYLGSTPLCAPPKGARVSKQAYQSDRGSHYEGCSLQWLDWGVPLKVAIWEVAKRQRAAHRASPKKFTFKLRRASFE